MDVLLFGATGMVGQGVLRECVLDSDVRRVFSVTRHATGERSAKFRELVHGDFLDFSAIKNELTGFDACFFCLGVSAAGLTEEQYERVTYGYTLAAARTLVELNPHMTFIYVSGLGTDSSEKGRTMWARVKGRTENALLRLPFKAAYMFRPGVIQPLDGIKSKTRLYRIAYTLAAPVMPLLKALFSNSITTTRQIGRAMIKIAREGAAKRVLENPDINRI